MKVAELVARLQLLDQDATVLVSSDEEGNHIGTLYDVEPQKFIDYGDEINIIHPDDEESYEDEDMQEGVILWP